MQTYCNLNERNFLFWLHSLQSLKDKQVLISVRPNKCLQLYDEDFWVENEVGEVQSDEKKV